jgi:hypothetical protein
MRTVFMSSIERSLRATSSAERETLKMGRGIPQTSNFESKRIRFVGRGSCLVYHWFGGMKRERQYVGFLSFGAEQARRKTSNVHEDELCAVGPARKKRCHSGSSRDEFACAMKVERGEDGVSFGEERASVRKALVMTSKITQG